MAIMAALISHERQEWRKQVVPRKLSEIDPLEISIKQDPGRNRAVAG
jgi:hypothetical protein